MVLLLCYAMILALLWEGSLGMLTLSWSRMWSKKRGVIQAQRFKN
ncbi:hypothetical protein Golob_000553, partial [Gossypium lobatum]|nr:hypothetical protein [Gossypium lobatum]